MFATALYNARLVPNFYQHSVVPFYGLVSGLESSPLGFHDEFDDDVWFDFHVRPFRYPIRPRHRHVVLVDPVRHHVVKLGRKKKGDRCWSKTCDGSENITRDVAEKASKTESSNVVTPKPGVEPADDRKKNDDESLVRFKDFSPTISFDFAKDSTPSRLIYTLPGVKKDFDVKVSLKGGIVSVSGRTEKKSKHGNVCRRFFVRSFRLPEGAVESNIEAEIKGGDLRIIVPRTLENSVEPRIVPIGVMPECKADVKKGDEKSVKPEVKNDEMVHTGEVKSEVKIEDKKADKKEEKEGEEKEKKKEKEEEINEEEEEEKEKKEKEKKENDKEE
ncbi:hypothetical protein AAMO2058_000842900 [Amorphochlora amoebiformis]